MSSFGEKILKNLGWNKGDGLGKTRSGMVNPLTVTLKNDTRGLGSKAINDVEPDTWDSIYKNALHSKNDESIEKLFKKSIDHGRVSAKFLPSKHLYLNYQTIPKISNVDKKRKRSHSPDQNKDIGLKKDKNDHTVYQSTKTAKARKITPKLNQSNYSASLLQIPESTQSGLGLSDAELFQFCKGRTCHPAARFGNKLSGKLFRVANL